MFGHLTQGPVFGRDLSLPIHRNETLAMGSRYSTLLQITESLVRTDKINLQWISSRTWQMSDSILFDWRYIGFFSLGKSKRRASNQTWRFNSGFAASSGTFVSEFIWILSPWLLDVFFVLFLDQLKSNLKMKQNCGPHM